MQDNARSEKKKSDMEIPSGHERDHSLQATFSLLSIQKHSSSSLTLSLVLFILIVINYHTVLQKMRAMALYVRMVTCQVDSV